MERVDVHDVEAPEGGTVEEDEGEPLPIAGPADRPGEGLRRVRPVHPDPGRQHALDVARGTDDDPDDGHVLVRERERAVVHAEDPSLGLHLSPASGAP